MNAERSERPIFTPSLGKNLSISRRSTSPSAQRALDRLLLKCLAKSPEDRWQSAADLADELGWIDQERLRAAGETDSVAATKAALARTRERWLTLIATTAVLASVTLIGWMFVRPASPAAEPVRFTLPPPDGQRFAPAGAAPGALAISPDGRQIAFVAGPSPDTSMLWIRSLDTFTSRPLAGTEGAVQPFWSPDGRSLGFVLTGAGGAGKLQKIAVTGGPPQELPIRALVGLRGARKGSLFLMARTDACIGSRTRAARSRRSQSLTKRVRRRVINSPSFFRTDGDSSFSHKAAASRTTRCF